MAALSCFAAAAGAEGSSAQTAFALIGTFLSNLVTQQYFFCKTFELLSNSPGKLFAAANFALVYIITAELFPTYIRTTAIGGTSLAMLFMNAFI